MGKTEPYPPRENANGSNLPSRSQILLYLQCLTFLRDFFFFLSKIFAKYQTGCANGKEGDFFCSGSSVFLYDNSDPSKGQSRSLPENVLSQEHSDEQLTGLDDIL